MPATIREQYKVLDQYHSQRSKIKVICAGAGVTGLYLAYSMEKRMTDYELTIYEKNPEIGGTWYENSYPGCACDVPSHNYTYTFRPNPRFSTYYASSAELLQYFKDFRDEFGLGRYIQCNSKIVRAEYNEDEGTWKIDVAKPDGSIVSDWCHVFVNNAGILNNLKWPDIPGRENFKGKVVHSAAWDESITWDKKRVGLIGTGSSAIQITPKVQQGADQLTIFIRSATWLAPQLGGLVSLDADPAQEGDTEVNRFLLRGAHPYTFTEEDKKLFEERPEILLQLRKKMELLLCNHVDTFRMGTDMHDQVETFLRRGMLAKLEGQEELQKKLIPNFPSGCRRLTPGEGYLESLGKGNVSHVYETIQEFTPKGMITADGKEHEFDLIICATGFDVAFTPFVETIGRGVSIQEAWATEPRAYLGIAAHGFPNYFITVGPRSPWGNGSIIPAIEINTDYIITLLDKMQRQNIKSIEVKKQAADDFCEHVDEWHKGSVWGQSCRSWYKQNRDAQSKPLLWCGMSPSYYKTMCDIRFEDYDYEYKNPNRFAYFGNGKIKADLLPGKERLEAITTYIRSEESPWRIE
ncbi:cyclohexanone monooxygenase [Leptodontidium sp. MPI-SDFR-AT-0119]|nr:cyclohexanone monooxygenase [Leptodontidium sp. MPI-SDFR-AT-0119]